MSQGNPHTVDTNSVLVTRCEMMLWLWIKHRVLLKEISLYCIHEEDTPWSLAYLAALKRNTENQHQTNQTNTNTKKQVTTIVRSHLVHENTSYVLPSLSVCCTLRSPVVTRMLRHPLGTRETWWRTAWGVQTSWVWSHPCQTVVLWAPVIRMNKCLETPPRTWGTLLRGRAICDQCSPGELMPHLHKHSFPWLPP